MITQVQNKSSSPVVNIIDHTKVMTTDIPASNSGKLSAEEGGSSCSFEFRIFSDVEAGHNFHAAKVKGRPTIISTVPYISVPVIDGMTIPCTTSEMPTNPNKPAMDFFNH